MARSWLSRESICRAVLGLLLVPVLSAIAGGCGGGGPSGYTPPAYAKPLKAQLEAVVKQEQIPGAVVMIRSPSMGNWSESFGSLALGSSKRIGIDDYYRVASNTKTMTGTIILQLVQEGQLSLDDSVSKYRPEVPNGQNITIAELLNMRSGLFDYLSTKAWLNAEDQNHQMVWTPAQLEALAFAEPPNFPPGQGFNYSNTNTLLLGLIIEQITGQSLDTAFQDRIFTPLGLKHTYLPSATTNTIDDPHAQGYCFGSFAGGCNPTPGQSVPPNDVTDTNPSWAWAAGGVISTPSDLARYAKALVGGGLLDPEMQQERLASLQVVPGRPDSIRYGYALLTLGPLIGHTGDFPGFNSVMYYDPTIKLTVIAYATINVTITGGLGAEELMKPIFAQFYPGQPFPGDEVP